MKTVAVELQPCLWDRSGVGNVTYELTRRLHHTDELQFHGNVFNFLGHEKGMNTFAGYSYPIRQSRWMHYGIYRRIWDRVPIPYEAMFGKADLSIFFNFVIPRTLKGQSMAYIHDFTYERFPETMSQTNYSFISENTAYSIAHAAHLLVNSEFTKSEMCELFEVDPDRVSVIYPSLSFRQDEGKKAGTTPEAGETAGASTEAGEMAGASSDCSADAVLAEFFAKHGIEAGTPYILFVGTIEPRKNLSRLLQAFGLLKEQHKLPHKLLLAGGKGWNNEEIYQTAEALSCKEDVVFTGFVSSAEKNSLFRHAELFAFPSVYEGFGMPPIEAMSLGCPVLTARAASLPEVCGDAAEMTDPFEISSIADGMYHVISDRPYRDQLIQRGYAQAERFSWDDSAEKLLRICTELC